MKSETPKLKAKYKWETIFSAGTAFATAGTVMTDKFSPEKLTGLTFLHIVHLFCAFVAVFCALGLVWTLTQRTKKGKEKKADE